MNTSNKLYAFLNLFRKGAVISDATLWKQRQVTATVLGSVIMAVVGVLNAYGYNLPIDNETALAIAGGVLGVVNTVLTLTTSDKVGFGFGATPTEAGTTTQQSDTKQDPIFEPGLEPEQVQQQVPAVSDGVPQVQPDVSPNDQHKARSKGDYTRTDSIYQN